MQDVSFDVLKRIADVRHFPFRLKVFFGEKLVYDAIENRYAVLIVGNLLLFRSSGVCIEAKEENTFKLIMAKPLIDTLTDKAHKENLALCVTYPENQTSAAEYENGGPMLYIHGMPKHLELA
jgi:hypothetical protein